MAIKSKTERQPIGQWPRHRAFELELRALRGYPDVGAHEPRRAFVRWHANQAEDDAAVRRAIHREIDQLLDYVLPQVPAFGPEYVVWRMPDESDKLYTWAHKVASRRPGKIELVCGQKLAGPVEKAIFGHETLVTNWGECIACAAGRQWDDELTGQMMTGGGQ